MKMYERTNDDSMRHSWQRFTIAVDGDEPKLNCFFFFFVRFLFITYLSLSRWFSSDTFDARKSRSKNAKWWFDWIRIVAHTRHTHKTHTAEILTTNRFDELKCNRFCYVSLTRNNEMKVEARLAALDAHWLTSDHPRSARIFHKIIFLPFLLFLHTKPMEITFARYRKNVESVIFIRRNSNLNFF